MWTEENTAVLTRMWTDGASAREIAAQVGVTRNAVIGKARRLNLPVHVSAKVVSVWTPRKAPPKRPEPEAKRERGSPGRNGGYSAIAYRLKYGKARALDPGAERLPRGAAPPPLRVPVIAAGAGQCRYMEGEVADGVCGHRTLPGMSWCGHHARIVFRVKARRA